MKQKPIAREVFQRSGGFAPILILIIIFIVGILGYIGYKFFLQNNFITYKNSLDNFSLKYPSSWHVSELGKNALTSRGTYFSPEKVDFTNSNYSTPKGFVRISVYDTKEMFRTPKYANVVYTSAKDLLDAMQHERSENKGLPTTPGPPTLKGPPQKQFLPGAISVNSIEALGDHDFMYWIIQNGKLYEFLAVYPPMGDNSLTQFDRYIDKMTLGFKIN